MEKTYDMIIVGSGPAGLSAAIYARRARLDALVIEKEMASGGQVLATEEVDNYPGLPGTGGFDLGVKFREHADRLGAVFVTDEVRGCENAKEEDGEELLHAAELTSGGGAKRLICENGVYRTKTLLIATGARHQNLGVPGEKELSGMGVSYCATCDGAFFRNKAVAVVGGGDVALEDAVFLSRICETVYLIHRREAFRGARSLQEAVFRQKNIEILWDTVVEEIQGEGRVERLRVKNQKTRAESVLPVQGVFIAVGILPNSQCFAGVVEMDEKGYIKAGEDGQTSVPGIFAAGDVRTKQLRQIVTAAADGANAVTSAERYLLAHAGGL